MGDVHDDDTSGDLALLPDLLERSFGRGPDGLPTPADRLATGRRALRRRHRMGVAATSLGVVTAVGLAVGLSGATGDRGADVLPQPSTQSVAPSTSASTGSDDISTEELQESLDALARKAQRQAHRVEQEQVSNDFPATLGEGGLIVKDGWEVVQRVEEPMGFTPPQASLGVVMSNGTDTRWMLLEHEYAQDSKGRTLKDAFGDSASADDPGKGYSRFEDWLASMVELQGGVRTQPLLTVTPDDELRPGPGATVEATRPAPVIERYSAAGDRMAQVRRDGRTWFVLVRGHGPDAEVIPVDSDVLAAPTFEAFVDHLTTQTASGEGVR